MDTAPTPRLWSEDGSYERKSRAPKRTYPSASLASKASYPPIINMIIHEPPELPQQYYLSDLLGSDTKHWASRDGEDKVRGYVSEKLPSLDLKASGKTTLNPPVDT